MSLLQAVMETMTYILAYSVYNLNLHNLPLNKAKEDKHRPRSKTVIPSEVAARNTTFSKVSFFRSPAQGKVARNEGLATSTRTQPRPTDTRPSRGLPSPIAGGPVKTISAPAEANCDSSPQPMEPPVSATAQAMFDLLTGPESSVIINPHVLCLSPDPRPSSLDRATYDVSGGFVVRNFGCQEVDPTASLGAHVQEPSTQDGLEQDSDSETKSNSSNAVLVVAKFLLRDSTPPPTSHPLTNPSSPLTNHQRDSSPHREPVSPTTDHPQRRDLLPTSDNRTQLKVACTSSPSGNTEVTRGRSVSSTSSSSLVDIVASVVECGGGTFLSKASSEGNLLGPSSGLLHQVKNTRPLLLEAGGAKQQQKKQQRLSGIRRVVSTDMAHRSTERVNCVVREVQPGVDSFCMFEEKAQASTGENIVTLEMMCKYNISIEL